MTGISIKPKKSDMICSYCQNLRYYTDNNNNIKFHCAPPIQVVLNDKPCKVDVSDIYIKNKNNDCKDFLEIKEPCDYYDYILDNCCYSKNTCYHKYSLTRCSKEKYRWKNVKRDGYKPKECNKCKYKDKSIDLKCPQAKFLFEGGYKCEEVKLKLNKYLDCIDYEPSIFYTIQTNLNKYVNKFLK